MQWGRSITEAKPADMTEGVTKSQIDRCSRFSCLHKMRSHLEPRCSFQKLQTLQKKRSDKRGIWIQSMHLLLYIYIRPPLQLCNRSLTYSQNCILIEGVKTGINTKHPISLTFIRAGEWHVLKKQTQKKMHQPQMNRWVMHAFSQHTYLHARKLLAWKSSNLKILLYWRMQQQTKQYRHVPYVCMWV